ncbi:MAG: hypothetical protein HZB51_04030 [Chloroflexi bacterium]|nr:hypothetical protein [Chloroflexota bacterium]
MTLQTIRLNLPDNLLRRLNDAADAAQQPLDDVLLQTIRAGLPPDLAQVPERFRTDLRLLNRMDNDVLLQIARGELEQAKSVEYADLLAQNQNGVLNEADRSRLSALREEADLLMFRRAYALALLKWRGVPIPESESFNDQANHSI